MLSYGFVYISKPNIFLCRVVSNRRGHRKEKNMRKKVRKMILKGGKERNGSNFNNFSLFCP